LLSIYFIFDSKINFFVIILAFFMVDSKILVDMIGAKVRVDFVKEAKCPPAFGNLYTWDPESHSLVIARFETKGFLN